VAIGIRRLVCALFVVLGSVGSIHAQDAYPTKPITLLAVFAAGGPSDTLARQMAEQIGRQWNAQLIVENVAGAGGMIGTVRGARAAPDGYTILTQHQGHAAAPALFTGLKFDPQADFEPIGLINFGASVVLSRKSLETTSMAELLAWLKTKGADATIGHAGIGSNSFICASVLQHVTGLRLSMVPYRGTGPAMNDLVAGQIDLLCDQAITSVPQIQAGTVKAYALTSPERLKGLEVPSNTEVGLPNLNSTTWNAAYAPKGTPKAILDKWNAALQAFAEDPVIVERFAATGFAPFPKEMRSREAHAKYLADQIKFFETLFTAMDVKKREIN
jgi:tripartite-type tricarboxylate transporter receptor subunit TctC